MNSDYTSTTPKNLVRYRTKATICPVKTKEQWTPDAKSQNQEDSVLLRWFKGLCGGTYLEMGALNGLSGSNSYLFNKQLGWKGLLIEPSPNQFNDLVRNRPDELATVQAAVCDSEQTLHYVNKGAVGGIWEFTTPSYRASWWKNITLDSPEVLTISCKPMSKILDQHVGETVYFDFYSLDVEGAELTVLQSIDFDKVGFGIIFLEASGHNERKNLAVKSLLTSNGYVFMMNEKRSDWFMNKDFVNIYKSVL